jgi:hypothetical protein
MTPDGYRIKLSGGSDPVGDGIDGGACKGNCRGAEEGRVS